MTLAAIRALAEDGATRVLVIVSKPPSASVAEKVVEALGRSGKPAVVHFVGAKGGERQPAGAGVRFASCLAETAEMACELAGIPPMPDRAPWPPPDLVSALASRLSARASLRGLFCGGTTGQEALAILTRHGPGISSNLHKEGPLYTDGTRALHGHGLLDLGADEFTVGRPHPMIEPSLRNERLAVEMADSTVGVLLFDCVLGYGSHGDPAGVLAGGYTKACDLAAREGRGIVGIVSVTGTGGDPQGYGAQVRRLRDAGLVVAPDNSRAALLAAALLQRLAKGGAERSSL
jgi:hypothetical protein